MATVEASKTAAVAPSLLEAPRGPDQHGEDDERPAKFRRAAMRDDRVEDEERKESDGVPSAAASTARPPPLLRRNECRSPHTRITGATMRSPSASPTHQTRQTRGIASTPITPPAHRDAVPIVALTSVLAMQPASTKASTSRARPSDRSNWKTRSSSCAPTTASSVFPAPIPHATRNGAPALRLTANAPRAMAGHKSHAKHQQRGERDAARRPNECCETADRVELEAQGRRYPIDGEQRTACPSVLKTSGGERSLLRLPPWTDDLRLIIGRQVDPLTG